MILQNKIIKLIMKVISTIFMIFVILYLSFILIQRINGNKSIFGYRLFTVVTPSMEPIYNVNDVVIVRDIKYNDVKSICIKFHVTFPINISINIIIHENML